MKRKKRGWALVVWAVLGCLAVPGAPVAIALEGQTVWNWYAEGVLHWRHMSFEQALVFSAMLALLYYTPNFLQLPGELELARHFKRSWWSVALDFVVVAGIWGMLVLIIATVLFALATLIRLFVS